MDNGELIALPTTNLKPGMYLATPKRLPIFGDGRLKGIDRDTWWLFGRWLADGCYSPSKKNHIRLAAHKNEVAEIATRFPNARFYSDSRSGNSISVWIYDNRRAELFRRLGFIGYDEERRVPSEIFQASDSEICELLRGYLTGDGYFTGRAYEFSSVSGNLIEGIQNLLLRLGIPSSCLDFRRKHGYRCFISDKVALMKLQNILQQDFVGDRKMIKSTIASGIPCIAEIRMLLSKAKSPPPTRMYHKIKRPQIPGCDRKKVSQIVLQKLLREYDPNHTLRSWKLLDSDVCWDEIVSVEELEVNTETYDLSVEDNENFFANNILAHNTERAVKTLQKVAEANAPCIVFIDECDQLGLRRDAVISTDSGVGRRAMNMLMDWLGDEERKSIVVGATNVIEQLDPAFMRAGRFDCKIPLLLPDFDARVEIIKVHTSVVRKIPLRKVDFKKIAEKTRLWSGAEIENLCVETARIARRKGKDSVDMEDFEEGFEEVTVNTEMRQKELEHFIQQAKVYASSRRLLREQLNEYVAREQGVDRLKAVLGEL
jgi:hypothetical protein